MDFATIIKYMSQAAAIIKPIASIVGGVRSLGNQKDQLKASRGELDANRAASTARAKELAADQEDKAKRIRSTQLAFMGARGINLADAANFGTSSAAMMRADNVELETDLSRIGENLRLELAGLDSKSRGLDAQFQGARGSTLSGMADSIFGSFGDLSGDSSPFYTPPSKKGGKPSYNIFGYKI